MHPIRFATAVLGALLSTASPAGAEGGERRLFVPSAIEHPDDTVTLPLHRGQTVRGDLVWFVVFDSSDGKDAVAQRVNHAPKLNNARGTAAVVKVQVLPDGSLEFPATVNFAGTRDVVPGPDGFPPERATPGPIGDPGYSPLIQLPDGTIRNAPHVANASGRHPKVVELSESGGRVRLRETIGFSGDKKVRYVSTEASVPLAAALEDATLAPPLNAAPTVGGDGTDSARASLAAFTNGQTGAGNPQRQGLSSALLDGLDPLNVLAWSPNQGRYSPLWDVHAAVWSGRAVATRQNLRQTDFGKVRNLAAKGTIAGLEGQPFGPIGAVVNCPIVSEE